MKILSINFGYNGSLCLLDNAKIIKHTSLNKINNEGTLSLITKASLILFFENTGITIDDIDYFVFVGYDKDKIKLGYDTDFVPDEGYRISSSNLYEHYGLEKRPVSKLDCLLPPHTESPYDYVKGHFLFKKYVKPAYIVSPDIAYSSYGYYTSEFNRSLNITVNSNEGSPYSGSMVSLSKGNNISVVERPKISVGKLYPKMTELLGFGSGYDNNTTIHDISTRYHIPKSMVDMVDEGVDNKKSNIRDNYELSFFFNYSTCQYYQDIKDNKMIPYSSFDIEDVNSKYVLKTAAITQKVLENTVIKLISDSIEKYSGTYTHNVVLSGDVFENRRLNTKILKAFKDIDLHIAPYNTKEVMSLGAALYVNNMLGIRRTYSRDFLLSTTPYRFKLNNDKGLDIDYDKLNKELSNNLISFNRYMTECTGKSMGYSCLLFDVDCKRYDEVKEQMLSNPYEKPILMVTEESFNEHFIDVPFTMDNNTVAKPLLPHIFKNFIHDDGYLNVFVINEKTNPLLSKLLKGCGKDYIGMYHFRDKEYSHIIYNMSMFEITKNLGIDVMIFEDKIHIK